MALAKGGRRRCLASVAAMLLLPASSVFCHAQNRSGGGGITFEEHRRLFPPAPVAVRAELRGGKAIVSWDKPRAADPSEKLAYDPAIDRYRVYRVGPGHNMTLIGETRATSFEDQTAPAGTTQRYAVTTVQRSGHESGPSPEAVLRIP